MSSQGPPQRRPDPLCCASVAASSNNLGAADPDVDVDDDEDDDFELLATAAAPPATAPPLGDGSPCPGLVVPRRAPAMPEPELVDDERDSRLDLRGVAEQRLLGQPAGVGQAVPLQGVELLAVAGQPLLDDLGDGRRLGGEGCEALLAGLEIGVGGCVVFTAPAGGGKSFLLDHVARRCDERRVTTCRATEDGACPGTVTAPNAETHDVYFPIATGDHAVLPAQSLWRGQDVWPLDYGELSRGLQSVCL